MLGFRAQRLGGPLLTLEEIRGENEYLAFEKHEGTAPDQMKQFPVQSDRR